MSGLVNTDVWPCVHRTPVELGGMNENGDGAACAAPATAGPTMDGPDADEL